MTFKRFSSRATNTRNKKRRTKLSETIKIHTYKNDVYTYTYVYAGMYNLSINYTVNRLISGHRATIMNSQGLHSRWCSVGSDEHFTWLQVFSERGRNNLLENAFDHVWDPLEKNTGIHKLKNDSFSNFLRSALFVERHLTYLFSCWKSVAMDQKPPKHEWKKFRNILKITSYLFEDV